MNYLRIKNEGNLVLFYLIENLLDILYYSVIGNDNRYFHNYLIYYQSDTKEIQFLSFDHPANKDRLNKFN
jgi:hypothetical protein